VGLFFTQWSHPERSAAPATSLEPSFVALPSGMTLGVRGAF
jgi:hypothetical protein